MEIAGGMTKAGAGRIWLKFTARRRSDGQVYTAKLVSLTKQRFYELVARVIANAPTERLVAELQRRGAL